MNAYNNDKVLQSQGDLSELYQQFIQRFPETIEQIYVYQTPDMLNSDTIELQPQDWQRIETDFPFIALGNALLANRFKASGFILKNDRTFAFS